MTADAIIVLGAALLDGGRPSRALIRRVEHGAGLFHAGQAPWLLVSGGVVRHPPAEAEVMGALARARGVPAERIVIEDRSRRTLHNARYSLALMVERGWRHGLVVTDPWHLPRALMTFRRLGHRHGLRFTGSGAPGGGTGESWWRAGLCYLREVSALVHYAVAVERERRRPSNEEPS